MALAANIALARVLAGGTGQGIRILSQQEEERERAAELERALKGQSRARRAQRQSGQGRLLGAILGAATSFIPGVNLLVPALATAAGSFAGQKFQTRKTAKEKLAPIGVGSFQVARGRERETEFRAREKAFGEDLSALIGGGATSDFMSALAFQSLLPGLFGKGPPAGELFEEQLFAGLGEREGAGLRSMIESIGRV